MREIPCIVCNNFVRNEDKKAIAEVCETCNGKNLDRFIKNVDYKTYLKIIAKNKKKIRITSNGELI